MTTSITGLVSRQEILRLEAGQAQDPDLEEERIYTDNLEYSCLYRYMFKGFGVGLSAILKGKTLSSSLRTYTNITTHAYEIYTYMYIYIHLLIFPMI